MSDILTTLAGQGCPVVRYDESMGTKRDLETLKELEQRRRLAGELLRRGVRPAEGGRWVPASRQAGVGWGPLVGDDGLGGLRRAGGIGRPSNFTGPALRPAAEPPQARARGG